MKPTLAPEASLHVADAARFSGKVRLGLAAGSSDDTFHLYEVLFDARARTNWHSHSGEQVLLCTRGNCIVQIRGRAPIVLSEKTAFRVPPGVVHWHGALNDPCAHLAANIATSTSWFEPVSDADYDRAIVDGLRDSTT